MPTGASWELRTIPYGRLSEPGMLRGTEPLLCGLLAVGSPPASLRSEHRKEDRVSRRCTLALRPPPSPCPAPLLAEGFKTGLARLWHGSFVAAFSARGFTAEGIVEAAKENYRALLEEHMHRTNQRPSGSEAPSCGPGLPRIPLCTLECLGQEGGPELPGAPASLEPFHTLRPALLHPRERAVLSR